MKNKPTQKERLKAYLEKANGWVSAKQIVDDLWLLQYNARIYELRNNDLQILNRKLYKEAKDGRKYQMGYFRLVGEDEDIEDIPDVDENVS